MVAKFIEVGRNKKRWEIPVDAKRDLYSQMYGSVKKKAAIMSADVDFIFDDGSSKSGSVCVGGFREVGRFELTESNQ